ncbi:hypothetical protein DAMA08_027670 [Martiniozyma asiatica (nom. inval.)]|nr:hypothetical protein DAMA08_027670 [Martiniozyma asiatica]
MRISASLFWWCCLIGISKGSSLLSLLSSNSNYSQLIQILQHSDLIDYVSELEDVTLLAPINDALDKSKRTISKKELKKMIINKPLHSNDINGVTIFETLLTSVDDDNNRLDLKVPILLRKDEDSNIWVENSHVLNNLYSATTNSVLFGIDSYLIDPKLPLCSYFKDSLDRDTGERKFQTFAELLSQDNTCYDLGLSTGNVTVIIPSDNTWDVNFSKIELSYLLNNRGERDRGKYLSSYIFEGMIGGNLENDQITTQDLNGQNLSIASIYDGDAMVISSDNNNSVESTQANYLLNNAILHYFEKDIFLNSDRINLNWTPRKYLIGLGCEQFVDEVDFRKINQNIDNSNTQLTIFTVTNNESILSPNAKSELVYHFAQDFNMDSDLNLNILLKSQYCPKHLKSCQKIKISSNKGEITVNDKLKVTDKQTVGNVTILVLDRDIKLPSEMKVEVAKGKLGYLKSASMISDLLTITPIPEGFTVFLPHADSWHALGITWKFLKGNPSKMEHILKNFILRGNYYTDFEGAVETTNLLGYKVIVQKNNEFLRIIYPEILGHSFQMELPISWENQILYDKGVAHLLDKPDDNTYNPNIRELPLPPDLSITIQDLINIEKIKIDKLLKIWDLEYLLDPKLGYSILSPHSLPTEWTKKSFNHFITLHVLPPGSLEKIMNCSLEPIATIDPKRFISCRRLLGGEIMLSIFGSGKESRVLKWGFTKLPIEEIRYLSNGENNSLSGLLILDGPIEYGDKFKLHLGWLGVVLGAGLGVFVCFLLLISLILVLSPKRDKGKQGTVNGENNANNNNNNNDDNDNNDNNNNDTNASITNGNNNYNTPLIIEETNYGAIPHSAARDIYVA